MPINTDSGSALRMTLATKLVAINLLARRGQFYGLQVAESLRMHPGTVYPILHRMQDGGWLSSEEEANPASGRPARRYYRFTLTGRKAARKWLAEMDQR